MVKMNGCAAIDSARPFRFLVDKAAVAADFHLRKWRLLTWETENSKHSKCSYTCENRRGTTGISLQNSKQIPVSTHTGAYHSGKQCTAVPTRAFCKISALLTFCKILLGNIPNPLRFLRNWLRSCGAEYQSIFGKWVMDFWVHGVQANPVLLHIRRSPFSEGKRSYSLYQAAPSSPLSS